MNSQKSFYKTLITCIVLTVVITGLLGAYYNEQTDFQNIKNNYLITEIKKTDKIIAEIKKVQRAKKKVLDKYWLSNQLSNSMLQTLVLFNMMAGGMPGGLHLEKVDQTGNDFTMKGVSQTPLNVATLINTFERHFINNSKVLSINKNIQGTYDFVIGATLMKQELVPFSTEQPTPELSDKNLVKINRNSILKSNNESYNTIFSSSDNQTGLIFLSLAILFSLSLLVILTKYTITLKSHKGISGRTYKTRVC